jgi:acyl carrier protein
MHPDMGKLWTRSEVRAGLGKVLVESLGVDEGMVTDDAALVRDLGAESIDFLDISFKCQQVFGIDLPARLIQERVVEWRDLTALALVVKDRYGLAVPAEELRTVAPATAAAILGYLEQRHGLVRAHDDERAFADALAERLVGSLAGMGLDLANFDVDDLAAHLLENLHSPAAIGAIMDRFTVGALTQYIATELQKAGRLATGT